MEAAAAGIVVGIIVVDVVFVAWDAAASLRR